MANTTADKLNRLIDTKEAIKTAIINKGQEVSSNDTFRSYAEKISNIETGTDTSDATATASDIAQNETAYVNGEKITGNVPVIQTGYGSFVTSSNPDGVQETVEYLQFKAPIPFDSLLFRKNAVIGIDMSKSTITDKLNITSNMIKSNETILGITGTYDGGVAEALAQSY